MEKTSEIYLAGGCFWGTEHFLKQIRGVKHTEVGYANGNTASPTYKEVCTDKRICRNCEGCVQSARGQS